MFRLVLWISSEGAADGFSLIHRIGIALGHHSASGYGYRGDSASERSIIRELSSISERTLLIFDGLPYFDPCGCHCFAGTEACPEGSCVAGASTVNQILCASRHLHILVTTTSLSASRGLKGSSCGTAKSLREVMTMHSASGLTQRVRVTFVSVSRLTKAEPCFVLQQLIEARFGRDAVPSSDEWKRLVHLERAAWALTTLRKSAVQSCDESLVTFLLRQDLSDLEQCCAGLVRTIEILGKHPNRKGSPR